PPMSRAQAERAVRTPHRYDRPSNRAPLYKVGQGVRALPLGTPGHTRLPGYARGRAGRVTHLRGHHVLPDASARGQEVAEPLYTVAFAAAELWPEAAHRKDEVMIDLWESYLEPL
ncbi:MAG TPA: SH3-like domain-containing protein, partial [Kiloniellales bacterium]|nr:SH3-like domain-containing protein [Kiloniellales bacterium]